MPLKVIKRHGSPFWYLRGSVRGVNVDESTKVADREQAESIRAKREWEIVNRQLGGSRAVATFLEAAVSYMENGGEARFVQPLLNHFMTTPLSQIGQAEVEACARKIYPGLAPATINRKVFTPISAIMMHAAERKLCDKPALERPKQPRGRVRWITFEEAGKLVAAPRIWRRSSPSCCSRAAASGKPLRLTGATWTCPDPTPPFSTQRTAIGGGRRFTLGPLPH
jgi:hypothetical protein